MAAKAAASVVWLTVGVIITFTPGRVSGVAAFADLLDFASADFTADFDSDFLVVTGAFDCTGADFAATFGDVFTDAGFAVVDFGTGLDAALAVTLGCALVDLTGAAFTVFLTGATALALAAVLAAVVFFMAEGFAVDLDEADLAAIGLAFFSVRTRGFADFFIAFAIEILPIKLLSSHSQKPCSVAPIN
jgi:hypothetical protein